MKIAKFNLGLAAILTLLMFAGCTNNKTQTQEPAQEETCAAVSFEEVLKTRRSVRHYDSTKTARRTLFDPATSCRTEISVRDLPAGLYVAHVSTAAGTTAIKFVVAW